ncbi:putative RDD family membrane protein YckC [Flavobacterium arsenatis]|uniref:RDD family membrane protein YckC n=1 Tax=Flavobacterium arsenatis TaxID=1484332 RepID=A0ABU1TLT7_9FLAO|nr:RDD family protein [Flavobacterium arsenatis]MDR6966777.1 putative RDD family membrane protein YckC [Flavobacterium arsenatis]
MDFKKQFSVDEEIIATGWQRFGNYMVDMIFIYIIIILLFIFIGLISSFFDSNEFMVWLDNMGDLEFYLIFSLLVLIYFIFFETFTSRSLAKYITGTIVVYEDGSKPNLGTITKRTLSRFIPFDALTFLGGARGWHDSISDTYVVSKKGLETKMKIFTELEEIGNSPE